MILHKVRSLADILRRDPAEFAQRIAAIAEGRAESLRGRRGEYEASPAAEAAGLLTRVFGEAAAAAFAEPALRDIERDVAERLHALAPHAPYTLAHNADLALARCCYVASRCVRPGAVVETGVGYGVTSAFMLRALQENGGGTLHSVDLPPLERGADDHAGALVPEGLRSRWTLHRGMSRKLLPALLAELGAIDLFVHDSLHTYDNMRFEFAEAWLRLREGGIVLADDIQGNAAFAELRERSPRAWGAFRQAEKPALFGIAVR